jgi:hypothetical protein
MGRRTVERKLTLVGANGQALTREVWGAWEELDPAVARENLGVLVERVWRNDRCMVLAHSLPSALFKDPNGEPLMLTHLAMVGTKDHVDLTWDEAQRAKAELLGADTEAIELYPAADRVMEGLTERHLWVFPRGVKFPLGFVPQNVRVRPDERDAEGNLVVHRLTPEELAAEAAARPEGGLTPSAAEALGLPAPEVVPEVPSEAVGAVEALAEEEAAAELAAMRAELAKG